MRYPWLLACSPCILMATLTAFAVCAQDVPADEDARERAVIQRFVAVLEKNPRRGTALDKVYAFHVERGSLDSTIAAYRERAEKADKGIGGQGDKRRENEAAAIWMIVGLLESLRGQEAAALDAFEKAERLDGASALASYYLGQTLVLVGQSDKAVEAFERAIQRQPARADLLEMFQALGRVHQRTARSDKALDVWNRLEQQFPNDERVQEQIATTLLDEEAFVNYSEACRIKTPFVTRKRVNGVERHPAEPQSHPDRLLPSESSTDLGASHTRLGFKSLIVAARLFAGSSSTVGPSCWPCNGSAPRPVRVERTRDSQS